MHFNTHWLASKYCLITNETQKTSFWNNPVFLIHLLLHRTDFFCRLLLAALCSFASDFIHKITVQASPGPEKRRNSPDLGLGSPPSFGPRLRAFQREWFHIWAHVHASILACKCSMLPGTKPVLFFIQMFPFWCALNHPRISVFLCFRAYLPSPLTFPLPALLLSLSHTHTLSLFQSSVLAQILSDFLSQQLSSFFIFALFQPFQVQFPKPTNGGRRWTFFLRFQTHQEVFNMHSGAVYWIKNKQGRICCSSREGE